MYERTYNNLCPLGVPFLRTPRRSYRYKHSKTDTKEKIVSIYFVPEGYI